LLASTGSLKLGQLSVLLRGSQYHRVLITVVI